MMRFFCWCWLLLFVWSALRPAWPLVEYIAQYEYISEVLCINKAKPELVCDGKCYLRARLAEAAPQPEEQSPMLPQIKWEPQQLFYMPMHDLMLSADLADHSVSWPNTASGVKLFGISPPTPPPQVLT